MVNIPILSLGAEKSTHTIDESLFGETFNATLVHQVVRAEQAAKRQGTAATKTRGKVSGGSKKPWRQKGTGRARAGSSRSPIWKGGGTIFGPSPRSYVIKINRKERKAALRSSLLLHLQRQSMAILDSASFQKPATKDARQLLHQWQPEGKILIVLGDEEREAWLSFRNLPDTSVVGVEAVGTTELIQYRYLLCSVTAIEHLTQLAGSATSAK